MKISLTNNDLKEFQKILETKDLNITVSDILLDAFLYTDFVNKYDFEARKSLTNSLDKTVAEIIAVNYGIDDPKLKEAIRSRISVQKCNDLSYKNQFVDMIKNKTLKNKNYKIETLSYEPYQLFALNEIDVDDNYKETFNIGFFDHKFSYTALFENNDLWMSVNPNEIETMRLPISKANGDVLILGLGMGYISYMMSLKNDVKSVTVIERNANNIEIIKSAIGDEYFKNGKIKIVKSDAIEYLKNNHSYDYIYADLWFNPEDGLIPYLELRKLHNKYSLNMDYWLETSLKQMKRRYLIELINEQLNGSKQSDYISEETTTDKIFKILYNETKNTTISSINDIKELLR